MRPEDSLVKKELAKKELAKKEVAWDRVLANSFWVAVVRRDP